MGSELRPYCVIEIRSCAMCAGPYVTFPKLRRKYCSDLCAAKAIVQRPGNRYTLDGAVAHLKAQKEVRKDRRSVRRTATVLPPLPTVPRNPVGNRHTPGSIAFTLLYGGPTFSFNQSEGEDRVGRGGSSAKAIQVGGPNL